MNLSKSLYTKGIQCPKALWLKKYKPSVLTPPDESAQDIFDTGNIVGDIEKLNSINRYIKGNNNSEII